MEKLDFQPAIIDTIPIHCNFIYGIKTSTTYISVINVEYVSKCNIIQVKVGDIVPEENYAMFDPIKSRSFNNREEADNYVEKLLEEYGNDNAR